jgi:plastocyanin
VRPSAKALPGLLAAVVLAGCGGGGGSAGDADVVVTAQDPFEFAPEQATAEAGQVTVGLVNEASSRHTLTFEGREADLGLAADAGDADSGTIQLEAGEYVYYCDLPGHREAGMEGILTVQ